MTENSYALVTGASSGLGADFAKVLAGKGYNLILVARREGRMDSLAQEIKQSFDINIVIIPMDLSQKDAASILYQKTKIYEVEVLINNAGFGYFGPFLTLHWDKQEDMIQLNVTALTQLTALYAKDMVKRAKGYILLVASLAAYQSTPLFSTYAASKSYVLHFGEAIHKELQSKNVSVTVLSPGVTETEFHLTSGSQKSKGKAFYGMKSYPVAQYGIEALFKRKLSVLPGFMNKFFAGLSRFFPRKIIVNLAYFVMKKSS